jgi:hypothetical protein
MGEAVAQSERYASSAAFESEVDEYFGRYQPGPNAQTVDQWYAEALAVQAGQLERPIRSHAPRPMNQNHRLGEIVQFQRLKRALREIVDGKGANLHYSDCYFAVYHLVISGRAIEVRTHAVELMKKLSLARVAPAFFDVCRHLESVLLYCEHTYRVKYGLKPLMLIAKELHERPVARRWRKVRLCALWHRRFTEWLVLYGHGRFGPDGSGAAECREEFYTLAGPTE